MSARYRAAYRSQPEEHAFTATRVEGSIPEGLRGTFLRTGPGLLEVGGDELNLFDGHALISGLSFGEAGCVFRSRFVKSPLYRAETTAGRMTQRRLFTNLPSRWSNLFDVALGNNAMHDVYAFGGRVVAGHDLGHFALDARSLETLGPESWGGAAQKGWDMSPMPYVDPASGRLVGWLKKQGGPKPDLLKFVELDERFHVVSETRAHPLSSPPAIVHDQRATPSWYVATRQGPRLSAPKALWGRSTVYEAFDWPAAARAELLLVSRPTGDRLLQIPLPDGVQAAFHVINAYEEGARLIVDLATYDGKIQFSNARTSALAAGQLTPSAVPTARRFLVDPAAGKILESRVLSDRPFEAPEVADARMGLPYRYAYAASAVSGQDCPDPGGYFYFGGLARLDVETGSTTSWSAGAEALCSPPSFVPRPGATSEDDGWLLCWVTEADQGTHVAVLDARDLGAPAVARIRLGIALPAASHVRYAAQVALSA